MTDLTFRRGDTCPLTNTRPPNEVLLGDNFHISYKASAADYGCPTTAIVLKGHVFLILNGNHKQALSELVATKGVQGCVDFYIENIRLANTFSEHLHIIGMRPDKFNLTPVAIEVIGQANIDRIKAAVNEPA